MPFHHKNVRTPTALKARTWEEFGITIQAWPHSTPPSDNTIFTQGV